MRMNTAASKPLPLDAFLRLSAEERLRQLPSAVKPTNVKTFRSALSELHVYEAELEIQNEELLDSRAQIEESRKKYFRHFDLAPVGLVRLSRDGLLLEANILGAQMLEVNRAVLHSGPRPFLSHVAPESLAVFEQHLDSAMSSGKMEMCEVLLRGAAGHQIFVRLQTVVRPNEGDLPDFYLTLTDLTERREIEQKLQQQKVLAEAAVASKDLFFAMLSHELRTPLTPLVALLEDVATDPKRPAKDLATFAIMRRNLDLETHLIDDLLDVSRIATGKLQLRRETIDLHRCLEQAIGICQVKIDGKGLQLDFEPAAPRHFVNADASRLHQVFWNLIKNAVKFTQAGGRIAIGTRCDDAFNVVVDFRDTGIGIDSWWLQNVFDAFFQIPLSRKQHGPGLGLGLAICKAITEAHGGTLTVTSPGIDRGTTFSLQLPTVAEPAKQIPGLVSDDAGRARREGMRLLLVEDHDDTRDVLARLLSRRGYSVEAARNSEEARTLGRTQKFDLLISDIALPDGTGYELLEKLSTEHGLRGIAISGFGLDADLAQSKAAGFLQHLVKPIDLKVLDTAIQRAAEQIAPRQQ